MALKRYSEILPILAACSGALAQAQDPGEKTVQVVRTSTAPILDGRLDEAIWSQAAIVEDLHQVRPNEYSEPSERSRIRLFYTEDALYVGAEFPYSEPGLVTAHVLRQGEVIARDDLLTILLDPFHDRRNGYRFAVNPNGVRDDFLYQNINESKRDWEGIWRAAATHDDQGWIAEVAIPFKTLSFDPDGETWGLNLSRYIAAKNEWIGWVSRNRNVNPSIAGVVTGFRDLEQGLGLDIVPSISLRGQKDFSPSNSTADTEPSLDLFYKLTPALNASLTINTDFSATEVDDRQVDLSRFDLFFPEKRAFFLKDSDIFEFGGIGTGGAFSQPSLHNGRPFFSRRLGLSATGQPVDLEYGGKLSGRIGRWNLGTLAIRQDAFQDVNATDVFVGRATANVLAESNVGVIVTNGDPRSNLDNSVAGVDFRYQNSRFPGGRDFRVDVFYQRSDTEGFIDDDAAWGFRVASPNTTGVVAGFGMKELQQNFNPALGFVNRRGIRDKIVVLGYTHRPRERYLRSIASRLNLQRIERISGGLQTETIVVQPLTLENHTGDSISLRYTANKEILTDLFEISDGVFIPPGQYNFDEYGFDLSTGTQRALFGTFSYRTGDFFNGDRLLINGAMTWTPSEHFITTVSYEFNDVDLPEGDFVVRLGTFQMDLIFSSTLSWVNLIQYDNVSETVGINSRLHWIPEAGREMFIVLNHSLQDTDRNDSFHSAQADLTLKFNYTFRF